MEGAWQARESGTREWPPSPSTPEHAVSSRVGPEGEVGIGENQEALRRPAGEREALGFPKKSGGAGPGTGLLTAPERTPALFSPFLQCSPALEGGRNEAGCVGGAGATAQDQELGDKNRMRIMLHIMSEWQSRCA